MASDLDRHCANLDSQLDARIVRVESLMRRFPRSSRVPALREVRDSMVVELHDMRRSHSSYDARRAEAYDDPTGQDGDNFDEGESSHGWQRCGGGYRTDGRGGYREDFGG